MNYYLLTEYFNCDPVGQTVRRSTCDCTSFCGREKDRKRSLNLVFEMLM